jgi:MOSC domain-containing protein YiiM
VLHADLATLEAGLAVVLASPKDEGCVELIVRRPVVEERETIAEGVLDLELGLVGDNWRTRGEPNAKAQLTLMNARVAALVARAPERMPLAGDQLFVDFDITAANAPPGTRLVIGSSVVEVSDLPHLGCHKFLARFGRDAHRFVCSKENRQLNLRGVNAFVVQAGTVRTGDAVHKLV